MRNIWNFARREYKLYFISPIAYIVAIAAFVIVGGVFVYEINFAASQSILGGGTPPDATSSSAHCHLSFCSPPPS